MAVRRLTILLLPVTLVVALVVATPAAPATAQSEPAVVISATGSPFWVGEWIEICYGLSEPAPVVVINMFPDDSRTDLFVGYDDTAGRCLLAEIVAPAGYQCIRVEMFAPAGDWVIAAAESCFDVLE